MICSVAANIPKHAEWPKIVQQKGPTYFRYQDFMKNVPDIIQRGHRLEELLRAREDSRAQEAKQALEEQKQKPFVEEDLEGAVGGTDADGAEESSSNSLADRLSALRASGMPYSTGNNILDSKRMSQSLSKSGASQNLAQLPSQGNDNKGESSSSLLPDSPHRPPAELLNGLASPQLERSGFVGFSDTVSAATGPDMKPTHIPSFSEFTKSYPTLDDFEHSQRSSGAGRDTEASGTPLRPLPATPLAPPKPSRLSKPPLPSTNRKEISVEEFFPMLNPGFDTVEDRERGTRRMVRKSAPKVLLLDVRPRLDWERRRIKGVDSVCIEPSTIRPGLSTDDIINRLQTTASAGERKAFESRQTYDVVVICDRESRAMTEELEVIYQAIYEGDYRTPLKQAPRLLVGGIERWSRKVGDSGVVGDETSPRAALNGESASARSKRQGVYIPGPPAALTPGGSHERIGGGGFDHPSGPSMPARAYQASNTATGLSNAPSHAHQPHIHSYKSGGTSLSPQSSRQSTGTFEYPSLAYQQQQQRQSPYGIPLDSTAPTPPPAAAGALNGLSTRTTPSLDQGRGHSLDIARRPTVPPPGGTPLSAQARQTSYTTPRVDKSNEVRVGMTGLKNVGNSCYMNSTLQCLSATIPLARFLLDGSYRKAINRVNPLGTQGALAEAFAQLIRVMWSEQYTFVSPVTFREAITRFAPSFRGNDQHDAQEFLAFLLDGLHEDLNYVKQKPAPVEMTPAREEELEMLPQQVASVKEWQIYRERNDSLIVDWFQGQFRNKLTCLTCGKTSTTYNAFLYLSLPIPPTSGRGGKVTLAQCLDAFTKDEILEKADAWHCPRCNKPRRATKKLTISRLPQVLLIHLKRFSFKGPFTDKIETQVTFPSSNLDLTNFMPPPLPPGAAHRGVPVSASQQPPYIYDLYGATHHFGSLSGGHYTATIRTQGRNGELQWMYCDDSRITQSDERQIHSPSTYILWLNRKGRGK